jgi:hypothetical protein
MVPNLQNLSLSQSMFTSASMNDAQAFAYVTPDALMSYCESRLRGIDTQVKAAFARQQASNQDQATLGNLANSIKLPSGDLDLSKGDDFKTALHTAQAMEAASKSCSDPATAQALKDAANKIYGKLNAVLKDRLGNQTTFETIDDTTTDANVDNIVNNGDGNHGGGISDGDKKYTLDQVKQDTTGAIQNIQSDLNSSAEMSMIGLQALMSQRQQAIQVCTNLVQSLGDQCNKVADNVGK